MRGKFDARSPNPTIHRMDASIYKRKRVFSIGEKSRLLTTFSAALENEGFSAKWSAKGSNVNAVVQEFHGNHFDIVLFGRRVKPENKKLIIQRFRSQNEQLVFIDITAPIIPLMVAQAKLAFLPEAGEMPCLLKTDDSSQLSIEVLRNCSLRVSSYTLKWLSRSDETLLFDARLQGGLVSLPLKPSGNRQFLVVMVDDVTVYIREILQT